MPVGGDINDADKGGTEPQLDAGRSLEIHRIACESATVVMFNSDVANTVALIEIFLLQTEFGCLFSLHFFL